MADKARLRCTNPKITLRLPWWPTDVGMTLGGWNRSELERPGKGPLSLPSSRISDDVTMGFTLRNADHRQTIAGMVQDLRKLARARKPSQLLLGDTDYGLFTLDPPQVTVLEFANDGSPSVADVSLTLKRASDATINVGLAKRVRGSGTGFATRG